MTLYQLLRIINRDDCDETDMVFLNVYAGIRFENSLFSGIFLHGDTFTNANVINYERYYTNCNKRHLVAFAVWWVIICCRDFESLKC